MERNPRNFSVVDKTMKALSADFILRTQSIKGVFWLRSRVSYDSFPLSFCFFDVKIRRSKRVKSIVECYLSVPRPGKYMAVCFREKLVSERLVVLPSF